MGMKKIVGVGVVIAMFAANIISVNAVYTDVSGYAAVSINALVGQGILTGQGEFKGTEQATRAFVVEMLAKGQKLEPLMPDEPAFSDVPKTHSAYGYIEAAFVAGWITGDTNAEGKLTSKFRPEDKINRAELMKLVVASTGLDLLDGKSSFSDVQIADWYAPYVQTAYMMSIVNGYKDDKGQPTGKFGPANNVIRQDVAVIVYQSQDPKPRMPILEDEEDNNEDSDETIETSTEAEVITGVDLDTADAEIAVKYDTAAAELAKIDYKNIRHGDGHYTGTLPAPEGTVVSGLIGLSVKILPSGSGVYKFINTLWGSESIACRDGIRQIIGSTGQAFENAWWAGFDKGLADFESVLQVYNNSVPAEFTAKADVYKDGYDVGYYDNAPFSAKYVCGDILKSEVDDAKYTEKALAGIDSDGWSVYQNGELEDVGFGLATPPGSLQDNYPQNPYANPDEKSYSVVTSGYEVGLNEGKGPIGVKRINFTGMLESETAVNNLDDLKAALIPVMDAQVSTKGVGTSCQALDYRNPAWDGELSEDYVGYVMEEYKAGQNTALKVKNYNLCFESGVTAADQKNYLVLTEQFYFLPASGKIAAFNLEFDNKVLIDNNLAELYPDTDGSDYYDKSFLDQFFGKLSGMK